MKKIVFTCVLLLIIAYSISFPEITINASKNGLKLWFEQILPSLLPFTILSSVFINSNYIKSFKKNENIIAIMLTFCCGFIFGFPIGAKLSSDFYKDKLLTENQACILAITTNNFSPMYVCGFALPQLFTSDNYITITYILLYLTPLVIATIALIKYEKTNSNKKTTSSFIIDMNIIDVGIINGFKSLIKICGYIILFSIITEFMTNTLIYASLNTKTGITLLLSNLEISNGVRILSKLKISERIKYIFAIQTLSFGGLSGFAQSCSILADSGLSFHKYIIGKVLLSLLLTALSVLYVFIIR